VTTSYAAYLARLVDLLAFLADRKFLGVKRDLDGFPKSRNGAFESVVLSRLLLSGHV
jgi:hypothetical protein